MDNEIFFKELDVSREREEKRMEERRDYYLGIYQQ